MRDRLILIVDDDSRVRTMLSDGLEHRGFRVATASNGEEGLRAIEREEPSLVLLDMQMPVLDGRGFARRLSQLGQRLPTIVISSDPRAEAYAQEIGALAWLPKPFRLARLLASIEEVLGAAS